MRNSLLYIFLLSIITSCTAPVLETTAPCTDPLTSDQVSRADRYNQLIEDYTTLGIPGIAVLIADQEGVWVKASGQADIVNDVDLRACHIGKLGSITKLFMGVLSHQLIDEGYFTLDDPINQWLSAEMVSRLPNAECATVGQLLNHSACIYDLTSNQGYTLAVLNNPNTTRSAEELLAFAYGQDAPCQCGEKSDYSNTHTLLLSLVMEAATGKSHLGLMNDYIIEPLGLDNTFYYDHSYPLPPTATHGYLDLANQGRGLTDVTDWNTGSGHGYTGLYSNVFDLYTFQKALYEGNILLSDASRDRMFSDFIEVDGGSWAPCYGAGKYFLEEGQDSTAFGHGGADLGYSAGTYYFPNQKTYLCFTVNYGRNLETDLGDIVEDFIDDVSDAAIGR